MLSARARGCVGRPYGSLVVVLVTALGAAACSSSAEHGLAAPARPAASTSTTLPDVVEDQQPAPDGSTDLCAGSEYGPDVLESAIARALAYGSVAEAARAVEAGKKARGAAVGCPAFDPEGPSLGWTRGGSTTAPSSSAVRTDWRFEFAKPLSRFAQTKPFTTLQTWGVQALGGYEALEAGEDADRGRLRAIVDLALANQYSPATSSTLPGSPKRTPGVWGVSDDPICPDLPAICVVFDKGPLAGHRVSVADTAPPSYLRGNLALEQGVFGSLLVEAARVTGDARLSAAARLAGSWCAQEPAVLTAAQVARNVQVLALLYGWTGDDTYRTAMLDKLDRSLLPGVLMDADHDGLVDGTSRPFRSLTAVAQVPGQMWDGRAARPENQGEVATALVEAYAALRDRHRTVDAARVRPYAVAVLDNVSHEVLDVGVPTHGISAFPRALATGLWTISRAERQPHPRWAQAEALLWNTGRGRTAPATVTYLRYLDGDAYVSAAARHG